MTSAACPACNAAPVAQHLAETAEPNMTFSVPGMSCAACIGTIERGLAKTPGVKAARVNLTQKRVALRSDLPSDDIIATFDALGYKAYPLDAGVLGQENDPIGRDLALRLGVAGFAMMNVMLLSVAVWSGAADATRDLFHLISAAIAVPVVGFSGQPFFRSAWSALRVQRLNMDVPISLAILLATSMSVYESLNGGQHAYFDAGLSLTFFLLIGRFLDHRTRASARSAARELAALEAQTAERIDGQGRTLTVPITALEIGDTVLIPTGVRVPVDGDLISQAGLMDRSFLTGESDPVAVSYGDVLNAGEVNLGAPIQLRATSVGEDTTLRRMARLVETAETARNRYTGLADRAAQIYAPAVHLLALLAFVAWIVISGDVRFALNVAIAVLIITCPCALGLAVPAVSTAAIGKLYELGFLVKSGTALERLAEVDSVVFDKTGTVTVPGVKGPVAQLSERDRGIARTLVQHSAHPVSRALGVALGETRPRPVTSILEVPGEGVHGRFGGDEVFLGNDGEGLVLRIGATVHRLEQQETLRPGAAEAVAGLAHMSLPAQLVTGDANHRALKVAKALGIEKIEARISPRHKHRLIEDLTTEGHRVAMVGDGLNDTAALAAAHASVAPSSAMDASRNAADVVLLRDGLGDVPRLFQMARATHRLSRQNFAIAAAYNAVAVPIALLGYATPLLAALAMSVSSITVLLNALRVRYAK
ncbi:MAG: heavy metal translocating P-type ATPase [Pseudomonadota bacterium]